MPTGRRGLGWCAPGLAWAGTDEAGGTLCNLAGAGGQAPADEIDLGAIFLSESE